jgi:lysophospholipase L1-like esterase
MWDDPLKPGRNGLQGLGQRIEMHSPLSLVILMLGFNDFQASHPGNDAGSAAKGIAVLVNEIRGAPNRARDACPARSGRQRKPWLSLLRRRQRHNGKPDRRHSSRRGSASIVGRGISPSSRANFIRRIE